MNDGGFRADQSAVDRLVVRLVRAQRGRLGKLVNGFLRLRGTDISPQVHVGDDLRLPHTGIGVVVHPRTVLGDRVTLYQNVTIGRADIWNPGADFPGIVVEDDVILGAGAVVLAGSDGLTLGRGTIVGANAVLTRSTGPGEVWAGNPAALVRRR